MESSIIVRGFGVSAWRAKRELDQSKMKPVVARIACQREWVREPGSEQFFRPPQSGPLSDVHGWSRTGGLAVVMLLILIPLWMSSPAISQMTPELKEALELHKAGKLKEAVDVYSEVIKKNPRSAEAFNWRGMAYDDLGQLDKALADYNAAIDLSPNYADAYNNRGEIYRKQKKYAEALADYKKATELDKAFAEAHYNMALIHELQQKKEQAAAEYGIYLRLKPDASDKQPVTGKIQTLRKEMAQARVAAGQPPAPGQPPASPTPPAPGQVKPGEPKPGAKPAPPKIAPTGMPGVPTEPFELGIPGVPPIPVPPDVKKAIEEINVFSAIMPLLYYIFTAVMLFLIANKTNRSLPWLAFIPILDVFLMLRVARKPLWWVILLILPVFSLVLLGIAAAGVDPTGGIVVGVLAVAFLLICVVAWLLVCTGIASARGKSVIWGIVLFFPCTKPIGWAYLGLSR